MLGPHLRNSSQITAEPTVSPLIAGLAVVLLLATCAAGATAAPVDPPTCTPGKKLDDRQQLVARYICELNAL